MAKGGAASPLTLHHHGAEHRMDEFIALLSPGALSIIASHPATGVNALHVQLKAGIELDRRNLLAKHARPDAGTSATCTTQGVTHHGYQG